MIDILGNQIKKTETTSQTEKITNYTYDLNGNTLKVEKTGQVDDSVVEYGYNELNQLVSYKGEDGTLTSFAYDGTGMRTSKTQVDTVENYYWDRGYISNEAVNGTITASNYIGEQGIFARNADNNTDYLFKNGHGDVVNVVRNGTVVFSYDYDAYGTQKTQNANDTNPFRYWCG